MPDGNEMHPDWLGGGGTVAPELPKTQSAPTLSMPKPTTVPAPSVSLTQPLGKLLGNCKDGGSSEKSPIHWGLGTPTLKVHKSCSCISSKKVKDPTAYKTVNPMKGES